jgi:hypothetical protein
MNKDINDYKAYGINSFRISLLEENYDESIKIFDRYLK